MIFTMSVMNFQKTFRDMKPPEKGSFPLDHEGSELSFVNACKSCMTITEICQDLLDPSSDRQADEDNRH